MNCPTKRNWDAEILLDYCAQTLTPVKKVEFEVHLKQCADCWRVVDAQKEVWSALDDWKPSPVSLNFDARLYARIAEEQATPTWRTWLRRVFQPAVPYAMWKAAVPLTACAVLAAGLFIRMPDAGSAPKQTVRITDRVDIEQVEQTLQDLDILTPPPAPVGSM